MLLWRNKQNYPLIIASVPLLFSAGARIYVYLSERWFGKVKGLCGDYDGASQNDKLLSQGGQGILTEFVNSWKKTDQCGDIDRFNIHLLPCHVCTPQPLYNMSCLMTKPTNWHVRPVKTQISLGIRPVWSESLLSAWRKLASLATHWAHSKDSDQTGRLPRLIWVFAGRTVILLVLSWGGSHGSLQHGFGYNMAQWWTSA